MRFKSKLWLAMSFFKRQPLRTWLAIIGIVISSAAMISILMIGQGFVKSIESQFSAFGNDKIIITPISKENSLNPNSMFAKNNFLLNEKDVKEIKHIEGVKTVAGYIWNRARVCFKNECNEFIVSGTTKDGIGMWSSYLKIEKGRILNSDGYEANLGYSAANDIFSKKIRVGDKIYVNDKQVKVVGIFSKIGTSISKTDDESISISIKAARESINEGMEKDEYNMIALKVDPELTDEIEERVSYIIMKNHRVKEDDFSVITSDYIKNVVSNILSIAYTFIIVIGIIGGIVGGLGVGNTIYMSVIEKRREISVMKAIGAKQKDIIHIFLLESVLLTIIGGLIGTGLGIITTIFMHKFGVPYIISLWMFVFILIYSLVIGIIAGFIPAYNGSRIDVVKGLMD